MRVSSYAASITWGLRSSAMARSPIAWRDSGPGSRLITEVPVPSSRAISRSMRRCTVRRNSPSAPLALPWSADMDETTITRSRPSDRSTSALVAECTPPSTYSVPSMVTGRK